MSAEALNSSVVVLGAGMVGVACALELQRRGCCVTLVDRLPPGRETSYGNAGVITRSSLIPYNNPGLWEALPTLLLNRTTQFRYRPSFVVRNAGWAVRFLASARRSVFEQTAAALDQLIRLSAAEHLRLLGEAGVAHRLRSNGWLMLFRSEAAFAGASFTRATLERFGVAHEVLDRVALRALEPSLLPVFARALWLRDAHSVDNPGAVVDAYARLFHDRGGKFVQCVARSLRSDGGSGWEVDCIGNPPLRAPRVVIALGPWAKSFLATMRIKVPMGFERGYHMHYGVRGEAVLRRPVYDTAGGYVLAPMEQGLRLTTGVELDDWDAPARTVQLEHAERAARQAFPLGARLEEDVWMGGRPTLPDSRPMIGEAPRHRGLWLAFGHQHIGFNTGPGTASLLGSMMFDEPPPIDPAPFRPQRLLS